MANQTYEYSGVTEYATEQATQEFDLSDGTPIYITCQYDPTQIPQTGEYALETNEGNNGEIVLTVGFWNIQPDSDTSGSPGWPLIQFNNGSFAGINFEATFPQMGTNGGPYYFAADVDSWSISAPSQDPPEIAYGTISTKPLSQS